MRGRQGDRRDHGPESHRGKPRGPGRHPLRLRPGAAAAAVLYLLPLVLFFLGYGLMAAGNSSGPLGGLLGAALGIGIAFGYDRLVLKKKKTVYTIIGYGPSAAH